MNTKNDIKYTLNTGIDRLKGVGDMKSAALGNMGIESIGDLIHCYPRAYQNRGETVTAAEIKERVIAGESGPFSAVLTIASEPSVKPVRRGMTILKVRAFDETGSVNIVYFNQHYLANVMHTGAVFRFFGRVTAENKALQMSGPIAEPYYRDAPLCDIVPVYPLSAGLKQKYMANLVSEAMRLVSGEIHEFLPREALEELSLPTYSYALSAIHHPETVEDIEKARRRLAFDELYLLSLSMNLKSGKSRRENRIKLRDRDTSEFLSSLPYELTRAQKRCVSEILSDMAGETLMNRILTGDVGCGKTVVAASAVYAAVKNGYRAAVMVPTEILAEQHAADFEKLFSPLGISCALLTGSTRQKAKEMILRGLCEDNPMNRVDVVIGTHALISDSVRIENLGLAVIDEQHRFGVKQRAALFEKAEDVHCLVMSATPIPRTMTLVTYGSIDISRIDELPAGRQKVDTFIVNESYRERLNAFIKKQADEGHQSYIVCPAVEESEEAESENLGNISLIPQFDGALPIKAAESVAEYLADALPELRIGLIHGKMKSGDRDEVMRAFERGDIHALVSTTVIEVGVNVPNATLMIVENAERFGLSQLHQLRGRVGRGSIKSYFILVSDTKNPTAQDRLKAIKSTSDGYEIAEYDLEQRGPGDFFSESGIIRQSGEMNFKLASSCTDTRLIERASYYAKKTAEDDPELLSEDNRYTRARLAEFTKKTAKTSN